MSGWAALHERLMLRPSVLMQFSLVRYRLMHLHIWNTHSACLFHLDAANNRYPVKQDVEKVTKSIAIAHNPKLGGRNNRRGSVASKADIEKIAAPDEIDARCRPIDTHSF
jgi:hypothetical protein